MAQYVMTMHRVSKVVPPKRQIIKDISLSFFPGAKIGLLGLNGSGKSTVLRIMAKQDAEFDGEISHEAGIRIGYLPQEPQLDPTKTVREEIESAQGEVAADLLADDDEGAARTALLPEVPTVKESGISDFVVQGWLGIVGPRDLPPEVVARLNASLRQAVSDPQTVAAIEKGGAVARASSAEEFGALIESDTRRWTRLVRDARIQVQ